MNWKNLALAAVGFAVLNMIVNTLGAFADMNYYTDPANAALWSKIMMPGPQPPGIEFYVASLLMTFLIGLIYAYAYTITRGAFASKKSFKADKQWEVGAKFGVFLFLISSLPGMFSMYLLFAVPTGLIISWTMQGFIGCVLSGLLFSKIIKSD